MDFLFYYANDISMGERTSTLLKKKRIVISIVFHTLVMQDCLGILITVYHLLLFPGVCLEMLGHHL